MAKALISIDYTVDFVADDGKLTAGVAAQAISDKIAEVTQTAYDRGDYLFFAIDGHDEGDEFHPETKLFPPHNIKGTSGRNLLENWPKSMKILRTMRVFSGWINAIIQHFQERIWIFVSESAE